mmetsp:Transcript_33026/g.60554  ORF Transcript_33026/g.60554 Transcript_33026/m.60554 type:complete len:105 (-) Transcript_33026:338-652(-)
MGKTCAEASSKHVSPDSVSWKSEPSDSQATIRAADRFHQHGLFGGDTCLVSVDNATEVPAIILFQASYNRVPGKEVMPPRSQSGLLHATQALPAPVKGIGSAWR